jgi:hypothetical protein
MRVNNNNMMNSQACLSQSRVKLFVPPQERNWVTSTSKTSSIMNMIRIEATIDTTPMQNHWLLNAPQIIDLPLKVGGRLSETLG